MGMLVVNDVPGLQSVASTTVTPASSSARASGHGRPARQVGHREQGRDDARRGERLPILGSQVREMVGARRSELGGELRARAVLQLVRMDTESHPAVARGRQHAPRLRPVERAAVAEHVAPARERCARIEHRAAHQVDVAVRVIGALGRDDVGAEERDLVGDRPGDREQPGLVRDREAVSRFHLERRGSRPERFAGEPARTVRQRLVGRGSGGIDRREDPAGLVWLPAHPRIELLGPVAREDQVRMGVHETGERGATLEVERRTRDAIGRRFA
jgi:hypothetical protein